MNNAILITEIFLGQIVVGLLIVVVVRLIFRLLLPAGITTTPQAPSLPKSTRSRRSSR